ncbi:MAG TPA: hypothetical protein PLG41_07750 [Leptospiraceae bacterium]|nr:hypothetical protein [Leptospiraceae bacterium]
MGKIILLIMLAAIASCYAAADKKRVRKSEQGQVLGLLLYYGTGTNEFCDESFMKSNKIIPIGSEVTHQLYFNDIDYSTSDKSSTVVREKQVTSYTLTLSGENCSVKVYQIFCSKNRYLRESLSDCERTSIMNDKESKTCITNDARITSIGIIISLLNLTKLPNSSINCAIKIKNNS